MSASTFAAECKELFNTTDLYAILCIEKAESLTAKEIKRAYYKCSLKYHPDRVVENGESSEKSQLATRRFQTLGRVYGILSDPGKKEIYDKTGVVDEECSLDDNDRDWAAYWRLLFKKVKLSDVEKFKQEYKGSEEEINDLKLQYLEHEGDFDSICEAALCADSEDDRERIRTLLQQLIDQGELEHFPSFDRKESDAQKTRRLRKSKKEASEAKQMLKEIMGKEEMEENDLANAIAKRSADRAVSFFQHLEEKYGNAKKTTASKKRKASDDGATPSKKKKK